MKVTFSFIFAIVLVATANPVPSEASTSFTCESRFNDFCHASNIAGYCKDGKFTSNAEVCQMFCRTHGYILSPIISIIL
ncbi:hypothetical protein GGI43DRAFT_311263 [Trichoderma evansii]